MVTPFKHSTLVGTVTTFVASAYNYTKKVSVR